MAEKEREINDRYERFDKNVPEGWKVRTDEVDQNVPSGWKDGDSDDIEHSSRLEKRIDDLRMKWAGTGYEIVLEKLEMLDSWKNSEDNDIKSGLVDWMFENDTSTLMEEGEDILDGLEMMAKAGEVSDNLLIDCTELITTLIVARNLDDEEMMPAVQKDGKSTLRNKKLTRQSRAENMMKIRKELLEKKNQRKQWDLRTWAQESYQDLEIKRVKRREASRRMETSHCSYRGGHSV